jgi:hypothetical protein
VSGWPDPLDPAEGAIPMKLAMIGLVVGLVLGVTAAARAGPPGWGPSAAAAVAVVIGLLALRWLIAQTIRRPAGSNWQLSPDTTTGTTHIDSHAAVRPLADEIEDYAGVLSATASLTGPRQHPHLYLRVSADDHADISELRRRIGSNAIPRLMQALNLPALPADMLLRLVSASGARTR